MKASFNIYHFKSLRLEDCNLEKPSLLILSTISIFDDEEKMFLMVDKA